MQSWNQGDDIFRSLKEGFNDLSDKVNKMVGEMWEDNSGVPGSFMPKANLYRTSAEYVWEIELPGVKKEAVKLSIQEGALCLRGEKSTTPDLRHDMILNERGVGRFDRDFVLPEDVQVEGPIKAKYEGGILTVRLPRTEPDAPEADGGFEVPIES